MKVWFLIYFSDLHFPSSVSRVSNSDEKCLLYSLWDPLWGWCRGQRLLGPSGAGAAGRRHSCSCGSLLLDAASPFVREAWEEIGSVPCSACLRLWFLEGWTYCVCTLHLRAMGTVSPSCQQCWMCCLCLSWLSCCSAAGITPAPACLLPKEGFLFATCVCAVWTADSVQWDVSAGLWANCSDVTFPSILGMGSCHRAASGPWLTGLSWGLGDGLSLHVISGQRSWRK